MLSESFVFSLLRKRKSKNSSGLILQELFLSGQSRYSRRRWHCSNGVDFACAIAVSSMSASEFTYLFASPRDLNKVQYFELFRTFAIKLNNPVSRF